jgi:gas vesicle structural protein
MVIAPTPRGYVERPRPSGLADVIDVILDERLVIDACVRVSLVGIDLRFTEAVNRLDISHDSTSEGLPQLMQSITSGGAKSKTDGVLEGVKDTAT